MRRPLIALISMFGMTATTLVLTPANAKDTAKKPFMVVLDFRPQENVSSTVPTLSADVMGRPVRLAFEDARAVPDRAVLGHRTNGDDVTCPVITTSDVGTFARDVLFQVAGEWGIRQDPQAAQSLLCKLTRFSAQEENKAVGSMYRSVMSVVFVLADANGATLAQVSANGEASRYGSAKEPANLNEVISDALKSAYSNAFSDVPLQAAWSGTTPAVQSASGARDEPTGEAAMSPASLLAEVIALTKQGLSADLITRYVGQQRLSSAFAADDLIAWKTAKISEPIIAAAMARAPGAISR